MRLTAFSRTFGQPARLPNWPLHLILVILLGPWFTPSSPAQVLYGSLTGDVLDSSGSAVSGASVLATHAETNVARRATTNAQGGYNFQNLQPGVYTVVIEAGGFQSSRVTNVRVAVNAETRVDAALKVGAVTETLTVEAGAATLQTERSDVHYDVEKKQLQDLPTPIGRNYQATLGLLPGVSISGGGAIRASNPAAAFSINVNGASNQVNNTRIDGATAANNFIQGFTAYVPALEAIQAVDVVTNSYNAEIGLAGGAAVNVQVKSGSNETHGSLFEFHTNNNTKARPALLPANQTKPKFIFNQFGGTLGGPIVKNKLFYFVSYEGTTDYRTYSTFTTIPTPAALRGDLTESPTAIYDPLTGDPNGANRQPFAGNIIPSGRINSVTRKLLPLWPAANLPGSANNYFAVAPSPYDRHTIDSKVNWNVNSKLMTFARVGIQKWSEDYPTVFGDQLGGRTVSGQQSGYADGATTSLTAAGTYIVSTNLVVDAYFGFNRSTQNALPHRLEEKLGLDFLGIPGTNGPRLFEGGWPRIMLEGYEGIGVDEPFMPWIRHDPGYSYVGNLSWNRGKHNVRAGGEFARRYLNHAQPEIEGQIAGASGGFRFASGVTQLLGGPAANRNNAFGAFLLGMPQQMGRTLQVPDEITLRSNFYAGYVQDRWELSRKLSVTLGLRYEFLPLSQRADRGVEFYNGSNNTIELCGYANVPKDCGVSLSKLGFAPRFGLAYRATPSLVIRVGFGITRDAYDLGPRGIRTNYPLLYSTNLQGASTLQYVTSNWANGIPAIPVPSFGDGIIPVPPAAVIHAIPRDINRGYTQSRNVSIQKELAKGFTAQVSYVGTLVIRQFGTVDLNAGQVIGAGLAGAPLNVAFGRTATSPEYRPLGTSNYNALQSTLQRRFSNGLQFSAAYTWAKAIGINSNIEGAPRVQAMSYFRLNRTVLDYDRTQVLQLSSVAELPFGRGKRWAAQGGWRSALLGGWQVNSIMSAMTGLPFSVLASGTSLNLPGSTQAADQVSPEVRIIGAAGAESTYFDPTAFRPVTAARFGNAGFNSMRGPGLINLDLGIFRRFNLGEKVSLQFRAEAFNATNTPHWSNPASNISSVVYNADGSIRSLGGFGSITSTNAGALGRAGTDERTFRFALRVAF